MIYNWNYHTVFVPMGQLGLVLDLSRITFLALCKAFSVLQFLIWNFCNPGKYIKYDAKTLIVCNRPYAWCKKNNDLFLTVVINECKVQFKNYIFTAQMQPVPVRLLLRPKLPEIWLGNAPCCLRQFQQNSGQSSFCKIYSCLLLPRRQKGCWAGMGITFFLPFPIIRANLWVIH